MNDGSGVMFVFGCFLGCCGQYFIKLCSRRNRVTVMNTEYNNHREERRAIREAIRRSLRNNNDDYDYNDTDLVELDVVTVPTEATVSNDYVTAEAKYAPNNLIVLDDKKI